MKASRPGSVLSRRTLLIAAPTALGALALHRGISSRAALPTQAATMPKTPATPTAPQDITGLIPGVRGQRAFPTRALRDTDPFLMLDHIGPGVLPQPLLGPGGHPHRGFETLSVFLNGRLHHADSFGNRPIIGPGDIQVMHAGSGIQHGGAMYADADGRFQEFQIWVNVPAAQKMIPPRIQNVGAADIPIVEGEGTRLRVLTGQYAGQRSPAQTIAETTVLHGTLAGNATLPELAIQPGYRALLYVMRGPLRAEGARIASFETIAVEAARPALRIEAGPEGGEFMLLTGRPIGEPVVMGGPFVMNTEEEIAQAFSDYRAGLFPEVVV